MKIPLPSLTDLGIDPEAIARLLPYLDSFLKWELLRLLHDNPDMTATIEDLARYLGRDETEVRPAARSLASSGILHQVDIGTQYVYSLVDDEELRQLVGHLVRRYLGDPLVRLALSSEILRSNRRSTLLMYATR